jgi:hypothetical protein
MVGDGSPIPLRPDLAAALPEKQEIPADPPPENGSKLNPLFVALPVAAVAFIAAFFLLGRSKQEPEQAESELHDSPEVGKDLRG